MCRSDMGEYRGTEGFLREFRLGIRCTYTNEFDERVYVYNITTILIIRFAKVSMIFTDTILKPSLTSKFVSTLVSLQIQKSLSRVTRPRLPKTLIRQG